MQSFLVHFQDQLNKEEIRKLAIFCSFWALLLFGLLYYRAAATRPRRSFCCMQVLRFGQDGRAIWWCNRWYITEEAGGARKAQEELGVSLQRTQEEPGGTRGRLEP